MDAVTAFAETHAWLAFDVAVVLIPALVATALAWLVATSLRDTWRAMAWCAANLVPGAAGRAETPVPESAPPFEAPRLPRDAQWSRVAGIVTAGLGHARATEKLHGAASLQLDAALYGLRRLSGDLRDLAPIREAAVPERIRVRWLRARLVERKRPDRGMAA